MRREVGCAAYRGCQSVQSAVVVPPLRSSQSTPLSGICTWEGSLKGRMEAMGRVRHGDSTWCWFSRYSFSRCFSSTSRCEKWRPPASPSISGERRRGDAWEARRVAWGLCAAVGGEGGRRVDTNYSGTWEVGVTVCGLCDSDCCASYLDDRPRRGKKTSRVVFSRRTSSRQRR